MIHETKDPALVVGLSASSLNKLIYTGELRSIKLAGRRLIKREDLIAFMNTEAK
jgi:excisionase family DNA binding protein